MLSAAVLIFAAAGCANKRPQEEEATSGESSASSAAEESVAEISSESASSQQESTSTEAQTSQTAVVIVTGGKEYGIQQPDATSVIELVPTVAPRPSTTVRPSTTKSNSAATTAAAKTTAFVSTTSGSSPLVPGGQTTTAKPTTTVPFVAPELKYGGSFSIGEGDKIDTVRIKSHSCALMQTGSVGITLTFEIEQYSGSRERMAVTYNCYDKSGKLINETPLNCMVLLTDERSSVIATAVATADTALVEFVSTREI